MSQSNVSHLPAWNDAGIPRPRPRPNFQVHSERQEQPKKKFVAKGHDSQLQDAQYGKFPVEVTMIGDGGIVKGTVSRRDKYTITIKMSAGANAGKDLVIFKHAIESILIEKAAVDGE